MNTAVTVDENSSVGLDGEVESGTDYSIPWKNIGITLFLMLCVYVPYKIYQHEMAFSVGLDSFEPEFDTYWMSLLWGQFAILGVVAAGLFSYIWMTRDRDLDSLAPSVEIQRYIHLLGWLVIYLFTIFILGAIYTESDAAWHQVTVRDTDFTPTHIPLFYFCVPVFIITGMACFLWARTRLPEFANSISVPFVLLITGPFMIMPNVGFNEWGHTFFYAEELFSAPVHWGFVVLGWAAMAAGGLLLQVFRRISELVKLAKLDD